MSRLVYVVVPQDLREEPRERFKDAQRRYGMGLGAVIEGLGHSVEYAQAEMTDPTAAYKMVRARFEAGNPPDAVVMACYLWADPPNGHAPILATPAGVPIAAHAYTAPIGAPLGEAPGEVFVLHTTCAARMCGRPVTRLFGALSGPGSEETVEEIRRFVETGYARIDPLPDPESVWAGYPELDYTAVSARAAAAMAMLRGKLVAMTGGHCMGMLPCGITPMWHCSPNVWGLNIPIVAPGLYSWNKRFEADQSRYMALGVKYVKWLEAKGVRFLYDVDPFGDPLPDFMRGYTPDVAVKIMGYYAAMCDIVAETGVHILGIPAQLEMTRGLFAADLIKGVACSPEGPEGRDEPMRWMTEGDVDGGVSEEVLRIAKLTRTGKPGECSPGFADVRCTIPGLGRNVWMMCNSGQCTSALAEGGWSGVYSSPQHPGYFENPDIGGTFAFLNPKQCYVVGLRVAHDQQGPYAVILIGETVQSTDRAYVVDAHWPQLRIRVFYGDNSVDACGKAERQTREVFATNHKHFIESDKPLEDAYMVYCMLRQVMPANRISLLYDGRPI